MIGTTLNHYRILRSLGSGGMGEVFAAEDTKLHRTVALKVLPAAVASDPERRERFDREAQSVASLNHPNIVTVHSVEQSGDVSFLTMELVEGSTLGKVIGRQGMALDQFFKLAIPIVDAVSAAHDRGITHRDLKPANIMVGSDERVKILDFGLAKLREDDPHAGIVTSLPTKHLTGDGRVLGTVAYMSPEQAEGKPVDHRSDIFSLGIVLYEMATGERPFKGDTNVSVLSSIIKDTPPSVTALNRSLPRELGRIIRHALVKNPSQRFQTAADLRNELEELKQDLASGELAASPVAGLRHTESSSRRWLGASATALGLLAIVGGTVWFRSRETQVQPAGPIEIAVRQLTSASGTERFPSLSADGKWVVYTGDGAGNDDIYLQSVGGQGAINLTQDSPDDDSQAVFSPDGESIVFRSERQGGGIFMMGRTGESVRRITDTGFNPAWSPDGTELVFATESINQNPLGRTAVSELWTAKVASGEKQRLLAGDAVQPSWSPHGYRIAYWSLLPGGAQRDVLTVPARGGPAVPVTADAAVDWSPAWSPDGRFLYFASDRGGSMNLWRVPVDEQSGRTLGQPQAVTTPSSFLGHLGFAADGSRMVYGSFSASVNVEKIGFDPVAGATRGSPVAVTSGSRFMAAPDASPDGASVAFYSSSGQWDIFLSRPDGTGVRQLTNDPAMDRVPRWAPDGRRIAFYSNRSGTYQIWTINPDGSGLRQVTNPADGAIYNFWSPDGSRIVSIDGVIGNKVFLFDPDKAWASQTPEFLPRLDTTDGIFTPCSWSRDGQRLLGEGEKNGIFVYSFATKRFTRFPASGDSPVWLSDSRRFVFRNGKKWLIGDIVSQATRPILDSAPAEAIPTAFSPDGRTIFYTRLLSEGDIWMITMK